MLAGLLPLLGWLAATAASARRVTIGMGYGPSMPRVAPGYELEENNTEWALAHHRSFTGFSPCCDCFSIGPDPNTSGELYMYVPRPLSVPPGTANGAPQWFMDELGRLLRGASCEPRPAAHRALKSDEPAGASRVPSSNRPYTPPRTDEDTEASRVPSNAAFLEPVSGLPFLPAGYWSQEATPPAFFSEFTQGFTFGTPMIGRSNATAADEWLTQMDIQGASVVYDLHRFTAFEKTYTGSKTNGTMNVNCSAHLIDSLRAEISRVAHHRSIAGWFLVDEPDGGSDKVDRSQQVDCLQRCADTIREVDARWKRPITCTVRSAFGNMQGKYGPIWMDFEPIVDVLMPDIYPVQVHPNHCWECVQAISATLDHIRSSTSKPIWLIAQAFGGNEDMVRAPSPFEERIMIYLSWIHGATGFGYFVHGAEAGQTMFPGLNLWPECRRLAREWQEIGPALLSTLPRPAITILQNSSG
eukprot:COSAG04_NODE_570_length_12539_cov_703.972910_1_plen_469_part_10